MHRSLLSKYSAVLLLLLLCAAQRAKGGGDGPTLPTISFYNLAKARVTLPPDLHSDRNLLLLYFQLTQQNDVNTWMTVVDHWHESDSALTAYVSLVSPAKNILSRWWQNASLRGTAPDPSRWNMTLPLYVNKQSFEGALDIHSEDAPVLLLLDRKGHVLGRVSGAPTDPTRAAMRSLLEAAGAPALTPADLPPAPQLR